MKLNLTEAEEIRKLGPIVLAGARRGILASAQKYVELVHDYIESGKSFTPRSGYLQNSIGWLPVGGDKAEVFVQAEYAKYLEFGTKGPYVIKPKRRKSLRIPVEGGYRFIKKAIHPGIKRRPFMFAEFEERKRVLLEVFKKKILESLSELDNSR